MFGHRPVIRLAAYLWASPNTLFGLAIGLLALLTGGGIQLRHGVIEFHGGLIRMLLALTLIRARAMTLGHVILGRDTGCLESARAHELGHVKQTELWGPLFLPVYLAASAWALLRGRHFYFDNWFERDAERRRLKGPRKLC